MKKSYTILFSVFVLLTIPTGCYGPIPQDQSAALVEALAEANMTLQDSVTEAQARLDAIEKDGSPKSVAAAQAVVDQAKAISDQLAMVSKYLAASVNPNTGQIDLGTAATGLTALLPPPFNVLSGLAAGLLGGFFRSRQIANASKSAFSGIERARHISPELDAALQLPEVSMMLRATQNKIASKLVTDARAAVGPRKAA